jgi:hypothetical protein
MTKVNQLTTRQPSIWLKIESDAAIAKRISVLNAMLNPTTLEKHVIRILQQHADTARK